MACGYENGMQEKPIIIIPARLGAKRFFGKPLHLINGKPMILHCVDNARAADIAEVLVACGDREIYECVCDYGAQAVMTESDLPSGSDRVYAALQAYDGEGKFDIVINLQGDLPYLPSTALPRCLQLLRQSDCDIASLGVVISDSDGIDTPQRVKIIVAPSVRANLLCGRAHAFSRSAVPYGEGIYYEHIGIYGYRRSVLAAFVALPPSPLELREGLEQWRALEANMRIDIAIIDESPISVDIPADIARAEARLRDED